MLSDADGKLHSQQVHQGVVWSGLLASAASSVLDTGRE